MYLQVQCILPNTFVSPHQQQQLPWLPICQQQKKNWKVSNDRIITLRTRDHMYKASTEGKNYHKLEACEYHSLKPPQNKHWKISLCICFDVRLSHLCSWRLQQCRLHLISMFNIWNTKKKKQKHKDTGDWNNRFVTVHLHPVSNQRDKLKVQTVLHSVLPSSQMAKVHTYLM